jgi:hypothetical protein
MAKKRISFSDYDAAHIYEWLVMYWVDRTGEFPPGFGGCFTCIKLGKRLEKLLGPREVARTKRLVRKYPNAR